MDHHITVPLLLTGHIAFGRGLWHIYLMPTTNQSPDQNEPLDGTDPWSSRHISFAALRSFVSSMFSEIANWPQRVESRRRAEAERLEEQRKRDAESAEEWRRAKAETLKRVEAIDKYVRPVLDRLGDALGETLEWERHEEFPFSRIEMGVTGRGGTGEPKTVIPEPAQFCCTNLYDVQPRDRIAGIVEEAFHLTPRCQRSETSGFYCYGDSDNASPSPLSTDFWEYSAPDYSTFERHIIRLANEHMSQGQVTGDPPEHVQDPPEHVQIDNNPL